MPLSGTNSEKYTSTDVEPGACQEAGKELILLADRAHRHPMYHRQLGADYASCFVLDKAHCDELRRKKENEAEVVELQIRSARSLTDRLAAYCFAGNTVLDAKHLWASTSIRLSTGPRRPRARCPGKP